MQEANTKTVELVELLFQDNANPHIKNNNQLTPLNLAINTLIPDVFSNTENTSKNLNSKKLIANLIFQYTEKFQKIVDEALPSP